MRGSQYLAAINVLQERLDIVIGWRQQNIFWRAFLNQFAVFQDGYAIAQAQRFIQVVRDEDNGFIQLRLQLQQLVLHFTSYQGVERRKSFVHQQDFSVDRKSTRLNSSH